MVCCGPCFGGLGVLVALSLCLFVFDWFGWWFSGFGVDDCLPMLLWVGWVWFACGFEFVGCDGFLKYFCLDFVGLALYVGCWAWVVAACGSLVFTEVGR